MTDHSDERLRELLDREEIRHLLHLYCRAVDRNDPELFPRLYWPDAVDDHGRFIGSPSELAEYSLTASVVYESTMHSLGTVIIELEGDVARAESYITAHHLARRGDGKPPLLDTVLARYIDRFERRDGEWRIASRLIVKMAHYRRDITETRGDRFVLGVRGYEDPAYVGPDAGASLPRG